MAGNTNLGAAKKAKTDEFYTQWVDIEREMNAYLEFDPDVFRGKTVLLPCDDPEWSNFTKFFALHFADYGLKKLISTSYAPASNAGGSFYQPTLFGDPHFDESKDATRGKVFTLLPEDVNCEVRPLSKPAQLPAPIRNVILRLGAGAPINDNHITMLKLGIHLEDEWTPLSSTAPDAANTSMKSPARALASAASTRSAPASRRTSITPAPNDPLTLFDFGSAP